MTIMFDLICKDFKINKEDKEILLKMILDINNINEIIFKITFYFNELKNKVEIK